VCRRDQRQIENMLPDVGMFLMDRVGQIGHPERVDRSAGKEDIEDGANVRHCGFTITQADGLCNRLHDENLFGRAVAGSNKRRRSRKDQVEQGIIQIDLPDAAILSWHLIRRLNILCLDRIISLIMEHSYMATVEKYERYSATLRIFGKIEEMNVIGMRLGLEPTRVRRRGETVEGTSERLELDFWEMTAPVTKDRPLEDHLAWLKARLVPRWFVLQDIKNALSVDLFCEYRSNHGQGGFSVPPEAMAWLAELGICLDVAVVFERSM